MRLRAVRITGPAERQLQDILQASEDGFGPAARERYAALVVQALEDLLDDPARAGVRHVDGRIHYHLRHSRARVPHERGRVGASRHLVVARIDGEDLLILAIAHDGMVDALAARIEEGEAS